jgi:hypothetical protein
MSEYRFDENDERQRYREQILLSFFKIQFNALSLCSVNAKNDLYERVLKINKKNENCNAYREILKTKKIAHDDVNLIDCEMRNETLFKNDNF